MSSIAHRARVRWLALVAMSDAQIEDHVASAFTTDNAQTVMENLHELYRNALIAGAPDTHLAGLAVAANSVARDLGQPRPRWSSA